LAIGEKLWAGKAKTMGMTIKGLTAEGVSLEATWMAQLMGDGRAKGIDGAMTYSGMIMMGPNGAGWSHGQGMFNIMSGDMAVVKGSGFGKVEDMKGKSVGLMSFMTMAPKLAWLNSVVALVTLVGDPMWTEFDVEIWEWK